MLLHNLFQFGLPVEEMVNIYVLYIRSILETSAVVWHSSITKKERMEIERVQKVAFRIILGNDYENYPAALEKLAWAPLMIVGKVCANNLLKIAQKIPKCISCSLWTKFPKTQEMQKNTLWHQPVLIDLLSLRSRICKDFWMNSKTDLYQQIIIYC